MFGGMNYLANIQTKKSCRFVVGNYRAENASVKYILFNISVKEKYILLTKKTW